MSQVDGSIREDPLDDDEDSSISWLLLVPEWPPVVAKRITVLATVCAEHERTGDLRVPRRLATDPRMQSVWKEIYRLETAVGENGERGFLHAASAKAFDVPKNWQWKAERFLFRSGEPDKHVRQLDDAIKKQEKQRWASLSRGSLLQDYAASVFLDQAFYFATRDYKVATDADIVVKRERLAEIGAQLEAMANDAPALGFTYEQMYQLVVLACDAYIRMDNLPNPKSPLIVKRHRTSPVVRAFVILMTMTSRELFDTPLHGTTATMANVIFDCTSLSDECVRQIVRGL